LNTKKLILIVGPTAVGKTDLSIEIAQKLNTSIISVDSRQFYKELEIGTAKPSKEELEKVKHYFINSHSIAETYSVGDYERDAISLLDQLFKEKDNVVAVGGSGLFVNALCNGIDNIPEINPEIREELNNEFLKNGLDPLKEQLKNADIDYYNQVDLQNPQRIIRALEVCIGTGKAFSSFRTSNKKKRTFEIIKIGLELPREALYAKINLRMDIMLKMGLEQEAKTYYPYKNKYALQTVGYTELFDYFEKKYDYEQAVFLLKRNSRRYAKRQLTWFKRDLEIKWFNPTEKEAIFSWIEEKILH
jgi:tRNA dimethylallyltransferase